ncbi:hypothetical protein ACKKBG_A19055 [Auxenochlorella protothecoides x Auxenochlorella symbiontica]
MTSTEVEALQAKLAKSERNRQKLRDSLALLKERALNTVELVQQHGALKALVSSEQEARALAEQALTAERSAAQAQIQALGRRLDDLVSAQRAEREAVQRQLADLARQVEGLRSLTAAARDGDGPPAPESDALAPLQRQCAALQAEMLRWRAAFGSLAGSASVAGRHPDAPEPLPPGQPGPSPTGQGPECHPAKLTPEPRQGAPPEGPRARAIAAMAQAPSRRGKRGRPLGGRPAATDTLALVHDAMSSPKRRARARGGAGAGAAKTAAQRAPQGAQAGQASAALDAGAAAVPPPPLPVPEPSLAISAAAPRAPELATPEGIALVLEVLTESGARRAPDAALDVVARLESTALEPSCPPALLLVGWETALLGCAAAVCRGGPGAATAAAPWFEAAPGDSAARGPTFSVCWMTAEARTCNAFPKLLRAAQELSRRLERAAPGVWAAPRDGTAAGAGGLGAEDAGAASLLARLRQRLHRRLLCSLACGEGEEGLSPSEHAALATGTAALARCQGSVQALRCLVLDLLCLLDGRGPAGGRARALLPPLTAALDVWPAALAPQSADPLGDRVLAGLRALLRAAHSHPGPPSTSLLQTPGLEAAAREGLLALGRAHWGWAGCGEGGGAATTEENGQTDDDSDPGVDKDLAPVSAVLTDWLAGGDKPSPIPASNDSDTPV